MDSPATPAGPVAATVFTLPATSVKVRVRLSLLPTDDVFDFVQVPLVGVPEVRVASKEVEFALFTTCTDATPDPPVSVTITASRESGKNPDAPKTHGYRPLGAVMSILAPPAPGSRTQACRSAWKSRLTRESAHRLRAATAARSACWCRVRALARPRYLPVLTAASETMSIRHPVSLAARRAFWPSLPMARESW